MLFLGLSFGSFALGLCLLSGFSECDGCVLPVLLVSSSGVFLGNAC